MVLRDPSDSRDRYSGDASRKRGIWPDGEEEFVILATMQCLFQLSPRVYRQRFSVNLGGHFGLLAQVIQVSRKAIAQIDGCRCSQFPSQPEALRNARLRPEMRCKPNIAI